MKKCAYLFVFILCIACRKDFVVENIKDKLIIVNAPINNFVTTSNIVTFWWEKLDGAERYSIQIVKPSFTAITRLVLDTSVTSNKYSFTLEPGDYQWRIKAVNNGGSTEYQTFSLKVDTTSNLSSQLVYPLYP